MIFNEKRNSNYYRNKIFWKMPEKKKGQKFRYSINKNKTHPNVPRHSPLSHPSSAGLALTIISPFRIVNSSDDLAI